MESNKHNFLMESNIHNLNSFQNQQIIHLNWRIKMEMYAFKSTDIGSATLPTEPPPLPTWVRVCHAEL